MLNSKIRALVTAAALLIQQVQPAEDPDYILGIKYFQAGQFQAAITKFKRVIQIDPDHLDAHYSLGKIAFLQERDVDAFELLRDCISLDPNYKDSKALHQQADRKSTRLNSSHSQQSRMPSSA